MLRLCRMHWDGRCDNVDYLLPRFPPDGLKLLVCVMIMSKTDHITEICTIHFGVGVLYIIYWRVQKFLICKLVDFSIVDVGKVCEKWVGWRCPRQTHSKWPAHSQSCKLFHFPFFLPPWWKRYGIVGGGGGPGWLRDGSVGEPEGLGREQYGAVRGAWGPQRE